VVQQLLGLKRVMQIVVHLVKNQNSILKQFKVGKITNYDPNRSKDFKDPFIDEPIRDSRLIV
jgi:hypothetical protein